MNEKLQCRVLYRQFLFRLMDVEVLSSHAQGDSSTLVGQFATMLIGGSVLFAYAACMYRSPVRLSAQAASAWNMERVLIALTMLVVGIFAVLSWDSTFLDRRDVLVLAPLPVRGRTLFAAKVAAVASALVLTVAALNSLSAFFWPVTLLPVGAGAGHLVRYVAAWWLAMLAAGAFLYCAILGVQGLAAQLPRRWYLRVSSFLQIAAFGLFVGVFCLEPSLSGARALSAPENQTALTWLPTYWFLGLLSQMSGVFGPQAPPVMALLARRAVIGLAVAGSFAAVAFLLSYLRTIRKIVEEPDIVPVSRGGIWLPRFGDGPQTAVAQFVIRTLVRSRQHRVIVALYLGVGFALVTVYMSLAMQIGRLTQVDLLRQVNTPMLAASIVFLCAWLLGTRAVFAVPLDLRANWLFRVLPLHGGPRSLAAVRRALMTLSVFPVALGAAGLFLWYWPWPVALGHLLACALLGSILSDAVLNGFRKIPFTCSYLPGKSQFHLLFWLAVVVLVVVIDRCAKLEKLSLAHPWSYIALILALTAGAVVARRLAITSANDAGPDIPFEERPSDELILLGLS